MPTPAFLPLGKTGEDHLNPDIAAGTGERF